MRAPGASGRALPSEKRVWSGASPPAATQSPTTPGARAAPTENESGAGQPGAGPTRAA